MGVPTKTHTECKDSLTAKHVLEDVVQRAQRSDYRLTNIGPGGWAITLYKEGEPPFYMWWSHQNQTLYSQGHLKTQSRTLAGTALAGWWAFVTMASITLAFSSLAAPEGGAKLTGFLLFGGLAVGTFFYARYLWRGGKFYFLVW